MRKNNEDKVQMWKKSEEKTGNIERRKMAVEWQYERKKINVVWKY